MILRPAVVYGIGAMTGLSKSFYIIRKRKSGWICCKTKKPFCPFQGLDFTFLFLTNKQRPLGFYLNLHKSVGCVPFPLSPSLAHKLTSFFPFFNKRKISTPIDLRKGLQAQQEQDGVLVDRRPEAEHGPCARCRLGRVAFCQLVCLFRQFSARHSRHLQSCRPK